MFIRILSALSLLAFAIHRISPTSPHRSPRLTVLEHSRRLDSLYGPAANAHSIFAFNHQGLYHPGLITPQYALIPHEHVLLAREDDSPPLKVGAYYLMRLRNGKYITGSPKHDGVLLADGDKTHALIVAVSAISEVSLSLHGPSGLSIGLACCFHGRDDFLGIAKPDVIEATTLGYKAMGDGYLRLSSNGRYLRTYSYYDGGHDIVETSFWSGHGSDFFFEKWVPPQADIGDGVTIHAGDRIALKDRFGSWVRLAEGFPTNDKMGLRASWDSNLDEEWSVFTVGFHGKYLTLRSYGGLYLIQDCCWKGSLDVVTAGSKTITNSALWNFSVVDGGVVVRGGNGKYWDSMRKMFHVRRAIVLTDADEENSVFSVVKVTDE